MNIKVKKIGLFFDIEVPRKMDQIKDDNTSNLSKKSVISIDLNLKVS